MKRWSDNAYNVVDTGEVRAVENIESFGYQLHNSFFRQLELTAQPQVESDVVRADTRVAASSRRTIISGMAIVVDVGPGQQIERMRAVVANDGSQSKARKSNIRPRAFQNGGQYDFVTLVECRTPALAGKVCLVHRRKVAIEIGYFVDGVAIGVAADEAEVAAELLSDFQNRAMV